MPEAHPHSHEAVLAWSFASLRIDPHQLTEYEVLSGGLSGASAYRLRFPAGDLVLKVTLSESSAYLLERARRELLFYQRLASSLRVQVPNPITSHCDDAIGICLLLRAYEPAPEPTAWAETRFVEAAEQLGHLHAGYWGKTRELSALWWLRRDRMDLVTDIRQALAHWERLRADQRFEAILTSECVAWIRDLLKRVDDFEDTSFPLTLCHGDFHAGNVLLDQDGRPVLADWHEVGPGRGPEDLSFFIQRATFSGGEVPVEDMVTAYHRSLIAKMGQDVTMQEIRRVMDAAELRTRLLHWPAFLTEASATQLTDMLDRIRVLAVGLSDQHR